MVRKLRKSRRSFLKGIGVVSAAGLAFPHIWIPSTAKATAGRGSAKHLIYIRLSGGFRFPTAFNGDVGEEFNPWGPSNAGASGTQWGVSKLLERDEWRVDDLLTLGVQPVTSITNEITVLPCVDHEPLSGSADGNHATGLERYLTGYVNGPTGLFTMINYGLREKVAAASAEGTTLLPAICMGDASIGRGSGKYAAYRPPVMQGSDIDRFNFSVDEILPPWARSMADAYDARHRDRQNLAHYPTVDAYIQSREATKAYSEIFQSDPLKIDNNSDEPFDGISNRELETLFGTNGTARNLRLALRLFHYGCPAVYLDQGGYDYHSDEQENLPPRFDQLNRIISALHFALKKMTHPEGGSYWDHTMVVFGSEFSRTTRGGRFNSAQGSDHGGDYATRWMSMPFMGGPFANVAGYQIGSTNSSDLSDEGKVFSYRATFKTLMDALDCDHSEFFLADEAYDDLFV
jgi:hypothetical protein